MNTPQTSLIGDLAAELAAAEPYTAPCPHCRDLTLHDSFLDLDAEGVRSWCQQCGSSALTTHILEEETL